MQLLIILAFLLPHNPDIWRSNYFYGFIFITIFISHVISKKIALLPAICFFYFSINAFNIFINPVSIYGENGLMFSTSADAYSAVSYITLLIIIMFIFLLDTKYVIKIISAFEYIILINSGYMIYNYFINNNSDGVLNNASIDSCLIACLFPVLVIRNNLFIIDYKSFFKFDIYNKIQVVYCFLITIIPLVAIIISKSSTGYAAILLFLCLHIIRCSTKYKYLVSFIIGISCVIIGYKYLGLEFLNDNGRLDIWKQAYNFIISCEMFDKTSGSGLGLFPVMSPIINKANFLWLHNDYLHILFETGIVGIVLFVSL